MKAKVCFQWIMRILLILVVLGNFLPIQNQSVLAKPLSAPFTDCATQIEIPAAECDALLALYNSTDGANWTNHADWQQTDTPCTWAGVNCFHGHVTDLFLSTNNLTGSIPTELGNLTNLTQLYLYNNQLTGPIPFELGSLANLAWLDLSGNQLNGPIPAELGNLTNLIYLYLYSNQLTGPIPPELGSLSNLSILDLMNNQLSGPIPPEFGNLTDIYSLKLENNHLDGAIPTELGNLASLELLYLGYNQLSGTIPPQLGTLPNLRWLHLQNNLLSGTIPLSLSALIHLQSLHLENNQLTGTIMPEFGNMTGLWWLYLGNNQFSGSIPHELGSLVNMHNLGLENNLLSGQIPTELGSLTSLMQLNLSQNQLSGPLPAELGNLINLEGLDLASNQLTDPIPTELGSLTNLTSLDLHNNQLTGSIPTQLGNLANLTELSLRDNLLTGSIPTQLGNLTQLTGLWLGNNQLTGSIPTQLGNLTQLTGLWLGNNQLTGSIPTELGNLTNLTNLDLATNQLSGSIPPELANLTNLTYLDLATNQLSGAIPPELGNLISLQELYTNGNQTSGEMPASITNLVNLLYFYYDCALTTSDPVVTAFLDEKAQSRSCTKIDATMGKNWIQASGWPVGTTLLTLTIDDPATPLLSPDYTATPPLDPTGSGFYLELGSAYTLKAGDLVTVSGGGFSKNYTVADIDVTDVDVAADIVSGTAGAGIVRVLVRMWSTPHVISRWADVVGGNWQADFSVIGTDPPDSPGDNDIWDIKPDDDGIVSWTDMDGNTTRDYWRAPNPRFTVQPDQNWVSGVDWIVGNTVTLTVDDDADLGNGNLYQTTQTVAADSSFRFNLDPDVDIDLLPGQYVTATDGITTKSTQISGVHFDSVNLYNDIVYGNADPNDIVTVFARPDILSIYGIRSTMADSDGNWSVNFSVAGGSSEEQLIVNLTSVSSINADDVNNCTEVNWPTQKKKTIDNTGGIIFIPNAEMQIPAGALLAPVEFTIKDGGYGFQIATNEGILDAVSSVTIGPEGTTFETPVTITLGWPDADDDGIVDRTSISETNLSISKDGMVIAGPCGNYPVNCNTAANTFSVQVSSLSYFVVGSPSTNNEPTVSAAIFSVSEPASNGATVGVVSYADLDTGQNHTCAIISGNGDAAFAINATTCVITVNDASKINYFAKPSYDLIVRVTDNGTPVRRGDAAIIINLIPPTCYTLTLGHSGQGSNPTASPANSTGCSTGKYISGQSISLSGTSPFTDWHISSWTGTDNNTSTASTNIVTMPAGDHTANVSYSQNKYTIYLPLVIR